MRQLLCLLRELFGLHGSRARACLHETWLAEQRAMKAEQRLDTADLELLERAQHAPACVLAVDAVDDELREQGVVERRHLGPCLDTGVHAHPRPRRLAVARDPPRRRQEARRRILGIDAALDRMAAHRDVLLPQRQGLTSSDEHLLADEVEARHELRHRVLDLDAGVHLEEVVLAALRKESFDGPGRSIARRSRRVDRDRADARAKHVVDRR